MSTNLAKIDQNEQLNDQRNWDGGLLDDIEDDLDDNARMEI